MALAMLWAVLLVFAWLCGRRQRAVNQILPKALLCEDTRSACQACLMGGLLLLAVSVVFRMRNTCNILEFKTTSMAAASTSHWPPLLFAALHPAAAAQRLRPRLLPATHVSHHKELVKKRHQCAQIIRQQALHMLPSVTRKFISPLQKISLPSFRNGLPEW